MTPIRHIELGHGEHVPTTHRTFLLAHVNGDSIDGVGAPAQARIAATPAVRNRHEARAAFEAAHPDRTVTETGELGVEL